MIDYFSNMNMAPMEMEECRRTMEDLMKIPIEYIKTNKKEFVSRIIMLDFGFTDAGIDDFTKDDEPLVAQFADWLDGIYQELGEPDHSPADGFRVTKEDVDRILAEWNE